MSHIKDFYYDEITTMEHGSVLPQLTKESTMSTPIIVKLYTFKGRCYYTKPGWEYRPHSVREDFGEWRESKTSDGKAIQDWLIKKGYRMVWSSASKGDISREYTQHWALRSLVGDDGLIEPRQLRQKLYGNDKPAKEVEDFAKEMCG